MMLEQYASIAEIVAAGGVIASIIFLAYQIKHYKGEISNSNWAVVMDRYIAMCERGQDEKLAEIVLKGARDYRNLSETEQFVFGNYFIEVGLAHEALIFLGDEVLRPDIREVPDKALRYWFSMPGVRDWYAEYKTQKGGFAPKMNEYIDALMSRP